MLFWLLKLCKNSGNYGKSIPGGSWEGPGRQLGALGGSRLRFSWIFMILGVPRGSQNPPEMLKIDAIIPNFSRNPWRSAIGAIFLEKCVNFLQKWPETSEDLMIFREFSFTTLTGAIAAELQGFRFNFNNLFSIFWRIRVARVVAGSRCESIESSMTSCQNGVPRFSWISNFWTKLRERGLHKRFTIRWKKTVEIHLKTRKSSKHLKKSVLEVDFPILGWFSGDFPWFLWF